MVIQPEAVKQPGGGVGEIGAAAVGGKADGIGDRKPRRQPPQLTLMKAVERARPVFGGFAHGADPEPAFWVGATIV